MEALLAWFDLNGSRQSFGPASDGASLSLGYQLLLYAVVAAGVLLSEAVAMARRGQSISLDLSPPWVATACLIALVIFPALWREIGAMPQASVIAQLGLAAQGGVFWGVLMAGAEKQARSMEPPPLGAAPLRSAAASSSDSARQGSAASDDGAGDPAPHAP